MLFASDDPPLGFFGNWDFPYLKAWDWGSLKAKIGARVGIEVCFGGGMSSVLTRPRHCGALFGEGHTIICPRGPKSAKKEKPYYNTYANIRAFPYDTSQNLIGHGVFTLTQSCMTLS